MDELVLAGPGGSKGEFSRGRRSSGVGRVKNRARLAPMLLVMLLIAAVCPLLPASPAGAAAGRGSITLLPENFMPELLNNAGQVAGYVSVQGQVEAVGIWTNGNLAEYPVRSATWILDFNDAGEILVTDTRDGHLEVISNTGVRILPNPMVDGKEKKMYSGFGPDRSGNVVGTHGWTRATESNSVIYQGSSPPSIITELATVLAANSKGELFGQLPGSPKTFGILSGDSVQTVDGQFGTRPYLAELSDNGHLLYSGPGGDFYLTHKGVTTPITEGTPIAVNSNGVVGLRIPNVEPDGSGAAALRFGDGSVTKIRDLVGGAPGWNSISGIDDVNDQCDVLGVGDIDSRPIGGYYLAKVDKCESIDIDGNFFRVDNAAPYVKKGEATPVRLRIENASRKELTNVRLVSVEAKDDGSGGEATIRQEGANPPGTLGATGLDSIGFADFEVTGVEPGTVILTAEVTATKEGEAVAGTIEREFEVRQDDLVVNLTLDPPEYEVPEDGVFEETDITATVSFTNATNEPMSKLKLQDLDVKRVFSGQQLYVTYKSGINPDPIDPEVIVEDLPAGATSPEFQAVFTATDNGEVEFGAMATAKLGENGKATGVKKVRWKAKVKKFIEIKTTVDNPADEALLNAGGQIIINGTVENLTKNFDVTLGPLYPTLDGNTGTMNVGYDGNAPNPTFPVPGEQMVLEPGQTRTFQVRITTNYSDPRMYEAQPSGGTRAYATFEPWGEAVERQDPNDEELPERVDIRTYDEAKPGEGSTPGETPDAQVLAEPTDLFKRISIDDSIELITDTNYAAVGAGILVGAVQGLTNAAIAGIYSIPDLVKMPYTILVAAYDFQSKVWDSFTEEEQELFLTETSFMIVSILQRNVEFGLKAPGELYDQVYEMAGEHLTKTQNDWYTGDYITTTQGYSAFLSETIGSVAGPVILSKMAQSPKAVAALERFQVAVNARMASTFAAAKNVKYVDNVLPILQSIENGAEPTMTAIAKLWGITPDEVGEYQRICKIIGCIATVRSRHASSIEWIQKFKAMLKPEALKIKTISELDVLLGYKLEDLGSLIFKKPEVLKKLGPGASKDDVAAEIKRFVESKGFKSGSGEHLEATKRVEMRVKEWNKHEKTYKQWDDRGWIDTTFNYEDNAIPDFKFDADGNIIGKLTGGEKGKFQGFQMVERPKGSDEFVVQMLDGKTGKWRRITGDIDPVDFTYTDGSPLSPEDLAKLTRMLQNSPLGAEHGYTATFKGFKDPKTGQVLVDPGPELVKGQFKPNEPALQIAPDAAPRAARIDVENSRWESPEDYNMRWVGGFVDAGTTRGRGIPQSVGADFDVISLDAPAQIALPVKAKNAEATVGRFIVKHGNAGDTAALIMGATGRLRTVLPDGSTEDSPLHDQAFNEGPSETITVAPVSTLQGDEVDPDIEPGLLRLPGFGGGTTPAKSVAGLDTASAMSRMMAGAALRSTASLDAGSDTIRVSTSEGLAEGVNGFVAGQELALGAGSDNMELAKVASVSDGVLTLTKPLKTSHEPGEVVVMVVSADGVPVDPDKGVDPKPDPEPDPTPGTDNGGSDGNGDGTNPATAGPSGASAGSTPAPGAQVAGAGATAGTGNGSATGATSSPKTGGPLAFTGGDSRPLIYLGSLIALLGVAFAMLGSRRRRSTGALLRRSNGA